MEVNPQYIVTIDSTIKAAITSNWQRVTKYAPEVNGVIKKRPSSTRRELITWILDTAGIYPQGVGGNRRYDDMLAIAYEIDNLNVGSGLELTTNEIEDNQLANNPEVGALDYAQKWGRDRGAEAAYFMRKIMFQLIAAGTTATGYDGVPFFSASHPVTPGVASDGTYSNIITGVPISVTPTGSAPQSTQLDGLILSQINFASALAYIAGLTFRGGTPRFLKPATLIVPTQLAYTANQLIGGGGFLTSGPAADVMAQTTNVLGNYQFNKPIIAPELNGDPTHYYIAVEDVLSDEIGALVFSERKPFELRGYPDASSAAQNLSKVWKWDFDGRNVGAYGHPYLLFKCGT